MLDRVRRFVGLDEVNEQIEEVVNLANEIVKRYCCVLEIPDELSWIVFEIAIARYNMIGSEGIKSESSNGISMSYKDDLVGQFKVYLDDYNLRHSSTTLPKVKML